VGLVTWIAHAQPASHSPFHSVTPSQPAAFQQACLLAGRLHCNSAVVAANGDGQLSHIGLPGGSNLAAQLPTMQPTGTNSGVTALFLGAGFVLIGTQDGTVQMGSFDGDMVQLTKHEAAVTDVHCAGSLVASSGMDGVVLVSYTDTGELVARLQGHVEAVNAVRLFASSGFVDANIVLTGSSDGNVCVWDLCGGNGESTCVEVLRNHAEAVHCLEVVGDRLFSGAADGVRVWAVSHHKCILSLPQCGDVRSLKVVASTLAVASMNVDQMEVNLWDWETTACLMRLETVPANLNSRFWLDMSIDRLALTCHQPDLDVDDSVLVWDFNSSRVSGSRGSSVRSNMGRARSAYARNVRW